MSTTEQLCSMLRQRHALGLAKYGVTMDREDLTPEQWLQHAIEEMLDGAGYLMRLKDEVGKMRDKIETLRDIGGRLFEGLDDKTPETTDCRCAPRANTCADCLRHKSDRHALKAWKEADK